MEEEQKLTHRDILEKGLVVFRKILNQSVNVNREEMVDILNFEVAITAFISNMKSAEGKSPEELLELAKKSIGV